MFIYCTVPKKGWMTRVGGGFFLVKDETVDLGDKLLEGELIHSSEQK